MTIAHTFQAWEADFDRILDKITDEAPKTELWIAATASGPWRYRICSWDKDYFYGDNWRTLSAMLDGLVARCPGFIRREVAEARLEL
ncbi:MAG TPA: hypothetical protein VMK12_07110 [Anaeromyxobacteraceae bacterium]|nr:hypothetical protein [Anaeromyxobacteraceae bacterium]